MGRALRWAAYWLVVAALYIIAGRIAPDASSTLEQPWREMIPWSWLSANWIVLSILTAAAVLTISPLIYRVMERRFAKELQRQIRQNLMPGSFPETDAFDALNYLLYESSWGWREYARLNSWEMVNGLHLGEFRRAARQGKVAVLGFSSREGKAVFIERREWGGLVVDVATIGSPHAVEARPRGSAPYLIGSTYSALAIPTADLKQVWPEVSIARRAWSLLWVRLKKRFWFGSRLSNWLDERRRRARAKKRGA